MEMESKIQERPGFITRASGWIKAIPGKIRDKVTEMATNIKKVGQDDPRRIAHSLKVGFALTLVSLLYYVKPLYHGFESSSMWAVLTVVVVFEFTVGATLCKSMNRGLATLLAGALGVGAQELASALGLGDIGEPILLGFLVFLLAAASTFARFIPFIKARHDYGVLIFILTFSLVAVSGYRVDEILELAHQRLSTILIGGSICIIISIFLCPVWAGEDLHKLVANNIEKLAIFLEGFGNEYFKNSLDGESGDVAKENKSFLQAYKSVLNTKATEEALANFAWWEPGHGRFGFQHPWKQYLKVGALARKCACHIEALSAYINSENEMPKDLQRRIQEPCMKMSSESGKALQELSFAIKTMTHPSLAHCHINNSKIAIEELKVALQAASIQESDLMKTIPVLTVASILTDVVKCVEHVSEAVHELSEQARFKKVEGTVSPEKRQMLRRGLVKPVNDCDGDGDHVVIIVHGISPESHDNGNFQAPKTGKRDVV